MIVIVLSNHPQAMLRAAQQKREAQTAEGMRQYGREAAAHDERVGDLSAERDQARAEHHWGRWARRSLGVHRARKQAPPRPAPVPVDERLEGSLAAGIEGEQRVEDQLAAALNDDWTLYRGYRNGRGEIDHLLLGPHGLAAIEVKNQKLTVSCDGDAWSYKKFSNANYLMRSGPLVDNRGRSPSQQLNQSVAALEAFLESRGCSFSFWRVVLFTHPHVQLGSLENLTVNLIDYSAKNLIGWLHARQRNISPQLLAKAGKLIERDHEFHQRRRHNRGAS